jgi:hypothetical protein
MNVHKNARLTRHGRDRGENTRTGSALQGAHVVANSSGLRHTYSSKINRFLNSFMKRSVNGLRRW